MRLLQVANVASVVGGTGACAFTIQRALPEFQHRTLFRSGLLNDELRSLFGDDVIIKSRCLPEHMDDCDIVLFHNTPESLFPQLMPEHVLPMFYQHSASAQCRGPRSRCAVAWAVSKFLADKTGIADEYVLHQPCLRPPPMASDGVRIGRLCTPVANKWRDCVGLYGTLSDCYPQVVWDFVGCPLEIQSMLRKETKGKCEFYPAEWGARSRLWTWRAMLYESSLHETYGRVVCEAQRCGCVPIVSKHSGFAEQISNGVDGFLCETPDEFVRAVRHVLTDEIHAEVSAAAVKSGDTRGSLENWRDKWFCWVGAALEMTV